MRRGALAWVGAVALTAIGLFLVSRPAEERVSCGSGFERTGARCLPGSGCPRPLALVGGTCSAKTRVQIPRTRLSVGPSDWEAEGRVTPRILTAGPFWIDSFEATTSQIAGGVVPDPLRAASGLTRAEAAAYCSRVEGRLPTEDEWLVAAAELAGHRYPWGDTGAVCRRAAFGLAGGPCAFNGTGPDTVGAHPDGDTSLGVHDLAGNVAEWVAPRANAPHAGVAKGGSWRTELATDLRVWARLELDPKSRDDRVGVRCAYDAP
jgi:formylglycine-generating enzyme required for sulfatase activity